MVTSMILVIDDLRTFPFEATYARTLDEALDFIMHLDCIDELWLDHDLGGDDTVMPVVDEIVRRLHFGQAIKIGTVYVHTDNPPGANNIMLALTKCYRTVRVSASGCGATVD